MQNNKIRLGLVLVIVTLFVGTSIIPIVISEKVLDKNIITVDDEAGDGDYSSIKEALNNSNPGDTIEVYSGIYYDYGVVIEKDGITLKGISHELGNGNDTGKPVINGEGPNYIIMVDKTQNVTISDFRMKNEDCELYVVIQEAVGCVLSDIDIIHENISDLPSYNDVSYSLGGCIECCYYSKYCKIVNNSISQINSRSGIFITSTCKYLTISNNIISNAEAGITFYGDYSNITDNKIIRCKNNGIDIRDSKHNTISYNTIDGNLVGLNLSFSRWNKIENNKFIDNQKHAQFFQGGFGANGFPGFNQWDNNYWGQPRILPYLIHGFIFKSVHWFNIDWHPAR